MSNYISNQQGERLLKMGYKLKTGLVSEALDFIREKGIECGVHPFARYNDLCLFTGWDYTFAAFDGEKDLFEDVYSWIELIQSSHPLAESALLDAVLTYLELSKEKKL